jgi:DNA-binding NarL/FixJ family response regulator
MTIRILLVDDHRIIREGLRKLLELEAGLEVVAEAENGRMALELVKSHKPDVVIMDIAMPDMNGIDATRNILGEAPQTRVVALSMHAERRLITATIKAGALGYILKDCSVEELVAAIGAVSAGKTYLSPEVAGMLVREALFSWPKNEADDVSALSIREREVLQLLADGKSTKDSATIQRVSVKTIETQRQRIMDKLDLHSIAALTKYAIREGLTTLN